MNLPQTHTSSQPYFSAHEMATCKAELKIVGFLVIVVAALWPLMVAGVGSRYGIDQPRGRPARVPKIEQRTFGGKGRVMQEDEYDYYDFYRKHEDIPSPGVGH
ncbi:hypothetical protein Ancab_006061 [Ancistrocladus abbreviatus]